MEYFNLFFFVFDNTKLQGKGYNGSLDLYHKYLAIWETPYILM